MLIMDCKMCPPPKVAYRPTVIFNSCQSVDSFHLAGHFPSDGIFPFLGTEYAEENLKKIV